MHMHYVNKKSQHRASENVAPRLLCCSLNKFATLSSKSISLISVLGNAAIMMQNIIFFLYFVVDEFRFSREKNRETKFDNCYLKLRNENYIIKIYTRVHKNVSCYYKYSRYFDFIILTRQNLNNSLKRFASGSLGRQHGDLLSEIATFSEIRTQSGGADPPIAVELRARKERLG